MLRRVPAAAEGPAESSAGGPAPSLLRRLAPWAGLLLAVGLVTWAFVYPGLTGT